MKYFILIALILPCIRISLQFVRDTKNEDKPLVTLFILILHLIAVIGYFNLTFTIK